jgi:hypothetical protein
MTLTDSRNNPPVSARRHPRAIPPPPLTVHNHPHVVLLRRANVAVAPKNVEALADVEVDHLLDEGGHAGGAGDGGELLHGEEVDHVGAVEGGGDAVDLVRDWGGWASGGWRVWQYRGFLCEVLSCLRCRRRWGGGRGLVFERKGGALQEAGCVELLCDFFDDGEFLGRDLNPEVECIYKTRTNAFAGHGYCVRERLQQNLESQTEAASGQWRHTLSQSGSEGSFKGSVTA